MVLDKATREAVIATVRRATIEMQEAYDEQWVVADQLCQDIPLFTKEWLKRYGALLPRECIRVKDVDGGSHNTRWCYPKKKILRLIADGQLRVMKEV